MAYIRKTNFPTSIERPARTMALSGFPRFWKGLFAAYDPTLGVTGGVLQDASGNGNDLALSGIVAPGDWPPDKHGRSVEFNGTDEYGSASVDFGTASKVLTISWAMKWAYADDNAIFMELTSDFLTTDGAFLIRPNNTATSTFLVSIQDSTGASKFRTEDAPRPASDEWHNYSIVLDNSTTGGNIKIYIDGCLQSENIVADTKDQSSNWAVDTLNLFSRDGASLFGDGRIGPLYIHTRELSANEIGVLHRDPHAPFRQRGTSFIVSVAPHVGNAYPPTVYTVQPSGDTLTVDPSGDTLGITGFVLPALTLAGVGEREVDAPAEITLPAMTMLGIGGDVSTGTSAMTLAAMRMLGYTIPSAQGAGDVVLPAMVLLGNTEFIQGTADLALPAMTMLAAVGISRDGTASMTLPAMQLDSVVRLGNFITSAMSLGAMRLSAAASFTTVESGTSAMTLPAMGVSGSASFTTVESGTSAITLGAMSLSGAAAFVPTGTSAITLPAIAMDSQAASLPVTSDIVLPAMTLAGAGQTVWDGTAEMDLGALTMEGSGARDGLSTSAMTLGAVTMEGSASFTTIVVGSSAITLAAIEMKSAASGIDTGKSGTSEMVLAAVTMAAAGVKSGDGTSAMTLPAMELRGRGGLAADDEGQWFNVTHIEVDATGTDKTLFLEPLTKPFQR